MSNKRYDPRELDSLLRELVLMNARTELYTRFLKRRVTVSTDVMLVDCFYYPVEPLDKELG